MLITDRFGREIRLTSERWNYIVQQHPEMKKFKDEFKKTIIEPDLVVKSVYDDEVVLYYRYFDNIFDGKYLVGIVKSSIDSFVLSGYATDRIKEGVIAWKKD